MRISEKQVQVKRSAPTLNDKVMDYITIGVGCNCLITLFESKALEVLLKKGFISTAEIEDFKNPLSIISALVTLEKCDVIKKVKNNFHITEFGLALSEYIGLITIFFDGYSDLVSKQGKIVKNKVKNRQKLIRGSSVSKSAILISEKMFNDIIIKEIDSAKLSGTICDLGCGYGTMLSKVCKRTGNTGLGIENEPNVVRAAKRKFENESINIELGDISNLQGIWEDVAILMQCHVFHDFNPAEKCIAILDSYLDNFPNMKCFYYIDTVSPSILKNKILPGFDYVHGLLGIKTRTYEETLQMFSASKYKVVKEVEIPQSPNTFLWLLVPKRAEG